MKMLKLGVIALLGISVVGCKNSTVNVDEAQQEAQAKALADANKQVGMPSIINWRELRQLKALYELRDRTDLVTYTYIVSFDGTPRFLTKTIGYGIPATSQFSNPEKQMWGGSVVGTYMLPQAEPNGIYSGDSSGTWIMAVAPDGSTSPMLVEPNILVSQFKLEGK